MSAHDALKVFGLSSFDYSFDDLKSRFKKLAVQHHPDKGGDLATMQKVNVAYELLSKTSSGGTISKDKESYGDKQARYDVYANIAIKALRDQFDAKIFADYFETIFGEHFTPTVTTAKYSNSVGLMASYSNPASTTVLDISVSCDYLDLMYNPQLSSENLGLKLIIGTTIFHNRRKVNISNVRYTWQDSKKVFGNPEILFPSAKLSKQKDKEGKRKISKRDIVLTFQKELKAEWNNKDWISIPFHGDFVLSMWRTTLMGKGAWSAHSVRSRSQKVDAHINTAYFEEDEEIINWLINELKQIRHLDNEPDIVNALNRIINTYKSRERN